VGKSSGQGSDRHVIHDAEHIQVAKLEHSREASEGEKEGDVRGGKVIGDHCMQVYRAEENCVCCPRRNCTSLSSQMSSEIFQSLSLLFKQIVDQVIFDKLKRKSL